MHNHNKRHAAPKQIPWVAIGLIALGGLFLLDNLDIIDFGDVWQFWPVIFILIGIAKLKDSARDERAAGWVFLGIGIVFSLGYLGILDWRMIWRFWPLLLIGIGVSILLRHSNRGQTKNRTSQNWLSAMAFFGGNERDVASDNFEGGRITTIFGGAEINFSRARLAKGDNYLDILTIFGGTEITVPDDWHVVVDAVPIFGGLEDSRPEAAPTLQEDSKLIIKGMVLFGAIELKVSRPTGV